MSHRALEARVALSLPCCPPSEGVLLSYLGAGKESACGLGYFHLPSPFCAYPLDS